METRQIANFAIEKSHIAQEMDLDKYSKNQQMSAPELEEKDKISDNLNFSKKIDSRYMALQNKLNNLQIEYTKEQMRINILQTGKLEREKSVNILYAGSPLFEESLDKIIQQKEKFLKEVQVKKETITNEIKVLELESENILPVDKNLKSIYDLNAPIEEIQEVSNLPLNAKVIEKLIKD